MKMHDPMREATDARDLATAMHESRPALQLAKGRERARVTLGALTWICGLLAVGAAIMLVVEIQGGARGVVEKWGATFPAWAALLAGLLVGAAAAWHSYVAWSTTGARHGILDQVQEPTGLRLVRRTWLGRRQQLLVGRNEVVTIAASLLQSSRGGTNRSYRFVVSTPSASFTFTQSVWIEHLTLAPLVPTARALGIDVVTEGEARSIALAS